MKVGVGSGTGRTVRLTAAIVATVAVVTGAAAAVAGQGAAPAPLPPVDPDRLVASALQALTDRRPISGRVEAFADLGLPALPNVAGAPKASGLLAFVTSLSGTHHLKVWRSPAGLRVTELLPDSERALYVSSASAWAWNFASFTAYRLAVGEHRNQPSAGPSVPPIDPLQVADRALRAIAPTTAVTVGPDVRVAGRSAYALILEPRTDQTLVGRIEIDLDGEHRLPLRVAVTARGRTSPSLWAAFSSVSFSPIDPGVYRFTPPPGATVRDLTRTMAGHEGQADASGSRGTEPGETDETDEYGPAGRTFGSGWTTVVALLAPPAAQLRTDIGVDLDTFLPLAAPLLSIRLVDRADHAWLVYGAVPQAALVALEDRLP
jgi:hypothetical protein